MKSVSKKLKTDFISKDIHIENEHIRNYIATLNFNTFIHIIKSYRLSEVTVYDPMGLIAHRLQEIIRCVKFLRVVTEDSNIYSLYNEKCLEIMGSCAAVCEELPRIKQQIFFCTAPLPKDYNSKGAFIIGEGGFNSVINSFLCEKAAKQCPIGIDITDFFTALAIHCSCSSLLYAVPRFLEKGNMLENINALGI